MLQRLCALALAGLLALGPAAGLHAAENTHSNDKLEAAALGIVNWKREDCGLRPGAPLLSGGMLEAAATAGADWYALALGRLGAEDDRAAYLAAMQTALQARRAEGNETTATEAQRSALAMLALGGDPRAISAGEAAPIDLIADGVFYAPGLGTGGVTAMAWGLLALDSRGYEAPADALNTRESLLAGLLARQLPDGGFALGEGESDADTTAMVLQALAPYAASDTPYPTSGGRATPRQAVEAALALLSDTQQADGGFASGGEATLESTAQVVIALCALGIDPGADARFTKNGGSALSGLLQYITPEGGVLHTRQDGAPSSMAGEQALLALTACLRRRAGLHSLYDMRPEAQGAPVLLADTGASRGPGAGAIAAIGGGLALVAAAALPLRRRARRRAAMARNDDDEEGFL